MIEEITRLISCVHGGSDPIAALAAVALTAALLSPAAEESDRIRCTVG